MHRTHLCAFLIFLACIAAGPALAVEQASARLTPDEARRAIDVLQNEQRRDEALLILKAIAEGAPPTGASEPVQEADAAAEHLDEAPEPAQPEPEPPVIVALEKDGLIARTLSEVDHWADGLGYQLGQLKQAGLELPTWSRTILSTEAGRLLLMRALLGVALIFAVGLAAEWLLRRMLRRPGRALCDHAAAMNARSSLHTPEHWRQRQAKTATEEGSMAADAVEAASVAKTRLADGDVALVQTHRHGVDRIDAVGVAPENAAGGGVAAEDQPPSSVFAEQASAARAAPNAASADSAGASPGLYLSRVRHLPYAAGALVLDLLPLALFFCVAALMMRWSPADDSIRAVTEEFVSAYIIARVTMALVRLLVSPTGHGMRLLKVSPEVSVLLLTWVRRFVVIGALGIALAEAAQLLGAGLVGRFAIIKVVSLVVHLLIVALIFRLRRPVAQAISAPPGSTSPFAAIRNWLAQIWAFAAAFLVMGAWVVWALGVENGFPKLVRFLGVSAGIIILARLVSILALGALARAFRSSTQAEAPDGASVDANWRPGERYYAMARRLVIAVIASCTAVALFEGWGVNALSWFAPDTIGRSLISALSTILAAAAASLVVWEMANAAIQRRLIRWTDQGDLMRAARLRTLLPMLRSFLMIIIVLVIGLTALNQIGVNTTPLLAGASIVGVALGFGSQKLVQDFITGIFLLMENAMQVGDWVTVAGVSGTVEHLSMRTVRLRAGDGSLHIVPFSSVSTVNNTNRGIGNAVVRVSVGYETDIEQVIDELKQIGAGVRSDPSFQELIINDIEVWGVDSVDGSMVTLAGQIRCIDKGRWGVQREMNRRILMRFRELGIEIADPRSRLLVLRGSSTQEDPPQQS